MKTVSVVVRVDLVRLRANHRNSPLTISGVLPIIVFQGVLPMKWRRGELNPCPRRYPRKHLHVYPAINSEEPSHAPAHCRLPSVREIDSQTSAVAPPVCQPAVHVFAASRRHCENVAIN